MSMVKRSKNDADALDHTVAAIEGLLCAPDYMTCNCELDGDMLREEEEEENKYLASFLPMGVAGETQQEPRRLSLADEDEPEGTLPDDKSQESGGESDPEDQVADEPAPVTHIEEEPPKQGKAQKRRFRFGGFGRRFGKKKA